MGGFDIYCAFCAAPFGEYDAYNAESISQLEGFDEEIISQEELEWLEVWKVIGFNADPKVNKAFITGVGRDELYGGTNSERGDDPAVPDQTTPAGMLSANSETVYLTVYAASDEMEDDGGNTFAAPFHDACLGVLVQEIRWRVQGNGKGVVGLEAIDKNILHAAVASCHDGNSFSALRLDYGELTHRAQEQYWDYCEVGCEAWCTNPFQSPKISAFFDSLKVSKDILIHPENTNVHPKPKDISVNDPKLRNPKERQSTSIPGSPFNKLSTELILKILDYLSYESLQRFALSGLIPLQLSNANSFWSTRISHDMPWLWDLPLFDLRENNILISYKELRRQSFATTATTYAAKIIDENNSQDTFKEDDKSELDEESRRAIKARDKSLCLGIANRRRIWQACSEIVDAYVQKLEERDGEI